MKFVISACLVLSTAMSSCQVHWSKATDWTLYGYQGNALFKIPIDSLKKMDTLKLDQDSMATFLAAAEVLHTRGGTTWMGGYIATCRLDGVIRKVEFSNYGGFFFDEKTKTTYQLPSDKIEIWGSYLQESFLTLARRSVSPK